VLVPNFRSACRVGKRTPVSLGDCISNRYVVTSTTKRLKRYGIIPGYRICCPITGFIVSRRLLTAAVPINQEVLQYKHRDLPSQTVKDRHAERNSDNGAACVNFVSTLCVGFNTLGLLITTGTASPATAYRSPCHLPKLRHHHLLSIGLSINITVLSLYMSKSFLYKVYTQS
jgi:hypothetical protein